MKCFFFLFIMFIETSSEFETVEVRDKKRRKEERREIPKQTV